MKALPLDGARGRGRAPARRRRCARARGRPAVAGGADGRGARDRHAGVRGARDLRGQRALAGRADGGVHRRSARSAAEEVPIEETFEGGVSLHDLEASLEIVEEAEVGMSLDEFEASLKREPSSEHADLGSGRPGRARAVARAARRRAAAARDGASQVLAEAALAHIVPLAAELPEDPPFVGVHAPDEAGRDDDRAVDRGRRGRGRHARVRRPARERRRARPARRRRAPSTAARPR